MNSLTFLLSYIGGDPELIINLLCGCESWTIKKAECWRIDAEAPIPGPPNANSWLIGKHPDAGKDWGQEEKVGTEYEMVGWYQWLNEHDFEHTLGDGEGQGSLVYCSPWGHKESDMTSWLNIILGWVGMLFSIINPYCTVSVINLHKFSFFLVPWNIILVHKLFILMLKTSNFS